MSIAITRDRLRAFVRVRCGEQCRRRPARARARGSPSRARRRRRARSARRAAIGFGGVGHGVGLDAAGAPAACAIAAPPSPTPTTTSMPELPRRAPPPHGARRRDASPSSRMSPSTAIRRAPAGQLERARARPAPPPSTSGFALYASLSTVTPDVGLEQLHPPPARASRSPARRRSRRAACANTRWATAIAIAAFGTWCAPCSGTVNRCPPSANDGPEPVVERHVGDPVVGAGRRADGHDRRPASPAPAARVAGVVGVQHRRRRVPGAPRAAPRALRPHRRARRGARRARARRS